MDLRASKPITPTGIERELETSQMEMTSHQLLLTTVVVVVVN